MNPQAFACAVMTTTALFAPPSPASAQKAALAGHAPSSQQQTSAQQHYDRRLFQPSDALIAASFTAATLFLLPKDQRIAINSQKPSLQNNSALQHTSSVLRLFNSPGILVLSGTMYAIGRLGHTPRTAELGLHSAEAVIVSASATELVKLLAGRTRPYVSADTNPHDFSFGRGIKGHDYQSLPSGHASAAFAFASVVTAESSHWWPYSTWWVAPILYGGATLVGVSRVYNNQHWITDVVVGAAIGTLSGLKTARFNQLHPDNQLDRWLLNTKSNEQAVMIIPTSQGITFLWTHPM